MIPLEFTLADKVAAHYGNSPTDIAMREFNKECSRKAEYILRNLIAKPIKGEINRNKMKCRGVRLVYENNFAVSFVEVNGNIRINMSQTIYVLEKNGKKHYLSDIKDEI